MNRFANFRQRVFCKLYLTPSGTFEKSISSLVFSVTGNMSQINPTASAVLSRTFPWMAKSNYILTKEPQKANKKSSQYKTDHLGQISRRVVDCCVDGWACGRGHQPGKSQLLDNYQEFSWSSYADTFWSKGGLVNFYIFGFDDVHTQIHFGEKKNCKIKDILPTCGTAGE